MTELTEGIHFQSYLFDMTDNKNNVEIFFIAMAEHFGVTVKGNYAWKADLVRNVGAKINVKNATLLNTWIGRKYIPSNKIGLIMDLSIPEDLKSLCQKCKKSVPEPYPFYPEEIGIPKHDSDRGSYGIPDLEGMRVTRIYDRPDKWYLNAVKEILKSGEIDTVRALKANIVEFKHLIGFGKRLNKLEREIEKLTGQLEKEKKARTLLAPSRKPAQRK